MARDGEATQHPARPMADWGLVLLTWVPAVGMIVLFVIDAAARFLLNAPLNFDTTDRLLAGFGYSLLAAIFLGSALTVLDWHAGRRQALTTLMVWPGLPIAGAIAGLGWLVLTFKTRGLVMPLELLANPLAAQAHGAIYMAAVVAALAFAGRDRRLSAVAAAPTALLMLPYLSADLSISGGILAQLTSLTAVVAASVLAAIVTRRLWPVAAACGAAIFGLVLAPIMLGLMTPTEGFAFACALVAIPALIVALVTSGTTGVTATLQSGAREIAALAAVVACASVVPLLLNLSGLQLSRTNTLGQVPAPPMILLACLMFVAMAVVLTPLLTIALMGALSVVAGIGPIAQGMQAATLAATVALGLSAMAFREALTVRKRPDDALLPETAAWLVGGVLLVIGMAAALLLRRTVAL